MSKVKIVQIAMTPFDDDVYSEYLDDMGRVWHQNYRIETDPETGDKTRKYYWEQVELPDEPEEQS